MSRCDTCKKRFTCKRSKYKKKMEKEKVVEISPRVVWDIRSFLHFLPLSPLKFKGDKKWE